MNVVGQRIKCIASEKEAFTLEGGKVIRWSASGEGKSQVFQASNGTRMILRSDNGEWWNRSKNAEANCQWAQVWYGEYPYGSWGIGFRVSNEGAVYTEEFETEINPRGQTSAELFVRDCRTYCP